MNAEPLVSLDTLCVEVTSHCALHCVHCSACASPLRTEMIEPSSLRALLEDADPLQEIYLSGGDPFEHPKLDSLLIAVRAKARRVVLYSSGTLLSGDGLAPLSPYSLKKVAELGIDRIDLSIYSGQPELHELVTATPGSFAATLESARRIRAAGIALGIHFVPLAPVEGCIGEILELAAKLGALRLHLLALAHQGRGLNLPRIPLSPRVSNTLKKLYRHPPNGLEMVFSSALRKSLCITEPTERDRWRSGFIDVRGHFYPGEGVRLPVMRSPEPVLPPRPQLLTDARS